MDALLDTSGTVAAMVEGDQWAAQARRFIRSPRLRLFTTSVIVGEAYTLVGARFGYGPARAIVRALQHGRLARVYHVDAAFDRDIWSAIDEFSGVPLSYADASLVVLGRRLRIGRAFSFDDDLRQAGLELVPRV
jgi:predicted nucleic acid-binding protein